MIEILSGFGDGSQIAGVLVNDGQEILGKLADSVKRTRMTGNDVDFS